MRKCIRKEESKETENICIWFENNQQLSDINLWKHTKKDITQKLSIFICNRNANMAYVR